MISGPVGLGASPKVRPTSVDHPSESEYLSEAELSFDCLRESRNLRLRLPFFLPGGFAAMGLIAPLGVDVFNRFARLTLQDALTVPLWTANQRWHRKYMVKFPTTLNFQKAMHEADR